MPDFFSVFQFVLEVFTLWEQRGKGPTGQSRNSRCAKAFVHEVVQGQINRKGQIRLKTGWSKRTLLKWPDATIKKKNKSYKSLAS